MKKNYIQKAEILTKHFGLYGQGHFNLSYEEIANILELLETKDGEYLDTNLTILYDRLHNLRMGETP